MSKEWYSIYYFIDYLLGDNASTEEKIILYKKLTRRAKRCYKSKIDCYRKIDNDYEFNIDNINLRNEKAKELEILVKEAGKHFKTRLEFARYFGPYFNRTTSSLKNMVNNRAYNTLDDLDTPIMYVKKFLENPSTKSLSKSIELENYWKEQGLIDG